MELNTDCPIIMIMLLLLFDQESSEPNLVKWAIGRASVKDFMSMNLQSRNKTLKTRTDFKLTRRPATRNITVEYVS